MLFLYSIFGRYGFPVIENISEMGLNYVKNVLKVNNNWYVDTEKTDQCRPMFNLDYYDVKCLINQYPKEWLVNEIEHDELLKYDLAEIRSFEPWWKLILGNKALLPLLWNMYPEHKNLLPAFYDQPDSRRYDLNKYKWVSKPLYGREGIGVLMSKNYSSVSDFIYASENNYGEDGSTGENLGHSIYQVYHKLPEAQGRVIQTSSWVIGGKAAGINFREGKAGTNFGDKNPFLPHYVVNKNPRRRQQLKLKASASQQELALALYAPQWTSNIYNSVNLYANRVLS